LRSEEGAIVLRVAPIDGTPVDVEIRVPAKTTENGVVDLVSDTLKTKNFELSLVSNSLTGLSINIERH
jgi:hypothetical protein